MVEVVKGERGKERRSIVKYRFVCYVLCKNVVAQTINKKGKIKHYPQLVYPTLS